MSKRQMRSLSASACAIALGVAASQAGAVIVTLEPTGAVTSGAKVENYFNGGFDSQGTNAGGRDAAGPSDNVIFPQPNVAGIATVFNSAAAAKISGGIPSGAADVLYQSIAQTMNFTAGYGITSLSFNYSVEENNSSFKPTVTVWSGTNGTGTALEVLNLAPPSGTAACASGVNFCNWTSATANFSGIGESVTFGGAGIGESIYDAVKMNVTPVPLPAALPLLLAGLGGFGALARRRRA